MPPLTHPTADPEYGQVGTWEPEKEQSDPVTIPLQPGQDMAPGSGAKDLRVRGLAVESSQLPWAHIKLAASLGLVKGTSASTKDNASSSRGELWR